MNPTNDQIDNAVDSTTAAVATKADEASAAVPTTKQNTPNQPLDAAKDAVTGLKNKIFGAVKRTTGA